MKIFLFILLILVLIPFVVVLFGAFLPSKTVTSYEQVLTKLPESKRDDENQDDKNNI